MKMKFLTSKATGDGKLPYPLPIADGWESSSSVIAGAARNLTSTPVPDIKAISAYEPFWSQLPLFYLKHLEISLLLLSVAQILIFLVISPVSCVWSFVEDPFQVSSVRLTGRHSPSLCHAPAIIGLVILK